MIRNACEAFALYSQRKWTTDRSQTVGASEIGSCARKTYFVKNEGDRHYGAVRDGEYADRWGARTRGSIYENHFWVPAMRAAYGARLLYAGAEQRTFVSGFLSATPDGLIVDLGDEERAALGITDGSDCVDLDCKTADPRTKLNEAKPEHAFQVIVQVGLIRELTNHQPTHGVLSYTDASFWDEIKTFIVPFDQGVYDQAKRRATEIMTARSATDLKPEGIIAGGRECELCPFASACGRQRADMVPKGTEKSDLHPEIASLALRARGLRDEAGAAMDEARAVEHELRDGLAHIGVRKMSGVTDDGRKISISWAPLLGRPSLDTKRLKAAAEAAGIDVSLFEKTGEASDRLVITLSGDSRGDLQTESTEQ